MSKMQIGAIIAIDGNVGTGKTSLITELNKKADWNKIEEYSVFFNNNKRLNSKKEYIDIQRKYLLIDKQRKKLLRKETNLLDRSFISLSAHVWALYKQKIIDIRTEYYRLLCEYIDNDMVILPDIFIYTTCDFDIIKKRCKQRQKNIRSLENSIYKDTNLYLSNEYMDYISEFNIRFHKYHKSWILNTGKFDQDTLSRKVIRKLHQTRLIKRNKDKLKHDLMRALSLSSH